MKGRRGSRSSHPHDQSDVFDAQLGRPFHFFIPGEQYWSTDGWKSIQKLPAECASRRTRKTCVGHKLKREETNVRQMALAASLTSEYVLVFWFFEAKTANWETICHRRSHICPPTRTQGHVVDQQFIKEKFRQRGNPVIGYRVHTDTNVNHRRSFLHGPL